MFLGKTSRRVLWRYLAERTDGEDAEAPLFLVRYDCPINKAALRLQIVHLGQKAGVSKCHPHRFRHTFAITYLRSGGDVFTEEVEPVCTAKRASRWRPSRCPDLRRLDRVCPSYPVNLTFG